LVKTLIGRLR